MKQTDKYSRKSTTSTPGTLKQYKVIYFIVHNLRKSSESGVQAIRVRGSKAKHYPELFRAKKKYRDGINSLVIDRVPEKKLAIVIHLYYPEVWKAMVKRLQRLNDTPFDLFITLPSHEKSFKDEIKIRFPEAHVVEVPNRGRDVLPFVKIAKILYAEGYEYVLKLHSKKSTHRVDGEDWLDNMMDSLIPSLKSTQSKIIHTLNDTQTAIIGPQSYYVSMKVNYAPNRGGLKHVLHQVYPHDVRDKILKNYWRYGFFAGTMFWARLDALMPVVIKWNKAGMFARETGQIDSTLAHALERCFCMVPEVEKKNMYQVGSEGLHKITYLTDNIPDWSKVQKK